MDEFVKLDAYHIRLARECVHAAANELVKAQGFLAQANGWQSQNLCHNVQKRINGLNNFNDWLGHILYNGCAEDK